MPGELGNEETQQGAGYYEPRYKHTSDRSLRPEDYNTEQRQLNRILRRLQKNNKYHITETEEQRDDKSE